MKSFPRIVLSVAAAVTCALSANAQSVTTDPVGFVTISIAAGGGSSRTLTPLSIPLLADSTANGQLIGQITSFTSNTISNSNAGWTAGELSAPTSPTLIKITSGALVGRTLLVSVGTANTGQTLTVDPADLVSADLSGLQAGDSYRIYSCDTLSNLFGSPETTGVLGGTSANNADNLVISVNGLSSTYYYDTGIAGWKQAGRGGGPAGNVALRPDAGILYNRLGSSPISLTILGDVPTVVRKVPIVSSGVSYVAQGWPANITLFNTNIQNSKNWVSGASASVSDTVLFMVGGTFSTYWFNGSTWMKAGRGGGVSDNEIIPVGAAMIVNKRGSNTGSSTISQNLPYSL